MSCMCDNCGGSFGDCVCDKARAEKAEVEVERLRELLKLKAEEGSAIRVELPTAENGMKCWVTSYKPEDEERIAGLLSDSLNLLCEYIYEEKKSQTGGEG